MLCFISWHIMDCFMIFLCKLCQALTRVVYLYETTPTLLSSVTIIAIIIITHTTQHSFLPGVTLLWLADMHWTAGIVVWWISERHSAAAPGQTSEAWFDRCDTFFITGSSLLEPDNLWCWLSLLQHFRDLENCSIWPFYIYYWVIELGVVVARFCLNYCCSGGKGHITSNLIHYFQDLTLFWHSLVVFVQSAWRIMFTTKLISFSSSSYSSWNVWSFIRMSSGKLSVARWGVETWK